MIGARLRVPRRQRRVNCIYNSPTSGRLSRRFARRQRYMKGGRFSGSAFDPNPAVVGLDELSCDVEADAQAGGLRSTRLLGTHETREEQWYVLGRDPTAVVGDTDLDLVTMLVEADVDVGAGVAVLHGVGEEIAEDLSDAHRVDEDLAPVAV